MVKLLLDAGIDYNIPLITNLKIAQLFLQCLAELDLKKTPIKSLEEYHGCKRE